MLCWAFILSVSPSAFAEYLGPVFPGETVVETRTRLTEPLPLPHPPRNPLLQRPNSRQVVFDDLDPVAPIVSQGVSQGLLYEEYFDTQPLPVVRQNRTPQQIPSSLPHGTVIIMDDGEYTQNGMWYPSMDFDGEIIGEYPLERVSALGGPIPLTFGMGLFDNLTLSAEKTAFKTELNDGAGSFGLAQSINWSTAVTPQGTITAQYGVRTLQGDLFSKTTRHQTFMTAGIFRRFAFAPVQGGVAVDWLHDHSQFGTVNVRQMRCELSLRSLHNWEYGFLGGFDVFRDQPTVPRMLDTIVDVQDHYLLFIRKHLDTGGQVEFRTGATARGDFIFTTLGEAAISDRLAVQGGISMLAPSEGCTANGNHREIWSMSLGIVLYFRGGAMSRPANLYRPMFDVAGNNSLFTRLLVR